MADKPTITCPICQHESHQTIQTAINTRRQPELKQKLLDGTLLMFECPDCGAKRRITTQVLYHDPDKKLLFFVAPTYATEHESINEQLNELIYSMGLSLDDYHMRIMIETAELMEKVQIFDSRLVDTEIELVKALTDGLFLQENSDKKIRNRYFYLNQDNQPKFLYLTEDDQLMVEFNQQLLDFIRSKFHKAIDNTPKGRFLIINHHWAGQVIQKKSNPEDN
ncbi:CpXC domain-containing protein [Tuanshanicoccus lijuaniae]|uniref:CpXC domain-containing protein n=1 Tax=Aerococcaceae bacterium zg-1292 TaxID=2774330 RepID=UPI001BD8FAFB|nr:CpXC domain-containing protein [Aerococcaceae bacterium zg-BR22]MBS4455421.1 CpXC domain-containing protein [Aerococcaceae bacterium zg-A91]MBS4457381.1 CpXC domain-containing protein [Aerococcaceae bacterium zg-BR33]